MRSYLHLTAGVYDVLIDTDRVREVMALVGDHVTSGWRSWRGDSLQVVDLAAAFGGKMSARASAVVFDGGDDGLIYLDVDSIGKVMRLEEEEFRVLPPLPDRVEESFDGVAFVPDSTRGLLRLRHCPGVTCTAL
jgi:chemotaxis signal transduction protein